MSGRGGLRPGSGRKRIYSSKKECDKIWQRGHRRINLDNIVYSSWVSSKIKCGYSSDSEFARHLLSLEWRRREKEPVLSCAKRKRSGRVDHASSKRRRDIEGQPLSTSMPIKPMFTSVQSPSPSLEIANNISDVDVTGISEYPAHNSNYQVADGSVILQADNDKYQDTDDSMSESESDDQTEETDRTLADALADALDELKDDCKESDYSSNMSHVDDREDSMCLEDNDYDFEVCACDSDSEPEERSSLTPLAAIPTTRPSASSLPLASSTASPLPPPIPVPLSTEHTLPISSASTGSAPSTGPIKSSAVPVQTDVQQTVALSDTPLQAVATSAAPLQAVTPSASQLQAVASSAMPLEAVAPSAAPLQAVASSSAPLQAVHVALSAAPVQTYPKLSRLEEQNILKEELSLVRETKIICSLDLLLNVFKKCQHPGCTQETAIKHHLNGPTAVINWACSAGYTGTFSSSYLLT